jgi:ribosomal protein S18 acetylase RimI-like enzyme
MQFSLASENQIGQIMGIIKDAQEYLASLQIDQWQDGYPAENQILLDVNNGVSYLFYNEDKEILATTVFTTEPESTYAKIEGKWLTNNENSYGVIHRLAVKKVFRKSGVAQRIFDLCEQKLIANKVPSMRIDTHEDNKGMQRLLRKRGYVYCGVIYLENGDKRLAFEKFFDF